MKKSLQNEGCENLFRHSSLMKKRLLMCLLAIISTSLSLLQANPMDERKYTIELSDISLSDAMKRVEEKTNYVFFYNNSQTDINKRVSVNVKSGTIENILHQLLAGYEYRIENEKIVILNRLQQGNSSSSPKKRISGTVNDLSGESIIGASITVKGANVGTITNIDGTFSLDVSAGDNILISYVGYQNKELKVTDKSTYIVQLEEDNKLLDEVVVVGYGVEKKVNVIGSIAQVGADKLENRSTPQLSNALTGHMSGVTITQESGKPGDSEGTIRVRGVGSFGATPSALVLIDGVPGSLNDVHPEDVESISVLKDASTAAIYGARAANGVILVTTKTGKEGKVTVGYSGYAGFNKATELPKFVDSWEWASLYNEAIGKETYSAEEIQQMQDGSNPNKYANENYLRNMLNNTGFQTGHDLTLNGGNKENKYMVSLGYLSQDGIVDKNNYSRYNARINLINEIHPKLKITTRLSGIYSKTTEPNSPAGDDAVGMTGIVQKALRFPGMYPTQLSDGTWGSGPENHGTPTFWMESPSFYRSPRMSMMANLRLDYNPIKDLNLAAVGAYTYKNVEEQAFKSGHKIENDLILGPSWGRNKFARTTYKSFQATADYTKSFAAHNFGILAGYSREEQTDRSLEGTRDKFPGNDLQELNAASPDNQKNSGTGSAWAIQSVFGRFKYNFAERYLFESTLRYDGSSRFPQDNKYALFPSAAIGWRLSEESFIKNNERLHWISNLKLKASVGKLGNQNIGNYPFQTVYALGQNYPFGDNFTQGAAVTTATDPSLKWEETNSIDGGLESVFWNGLLSANITYFHRKTSDILYAPSGSVSAVWGYQPAVMNIGELKNYGWEFELGHKNKIGDFSYNVSANMSIIRNEVISLGVGDITQLNGMVGNGSSLFNGYPMNMYYGYVSDGVFLNQDEVSTWHNQTEVNPNSQAGDIRYKDISGPDGVPDGVVDPRYDRVYLGSRIPKYTYGINLGGEYKGFDFSVLIQGVGGVKGKLSEYAGWGLFSNNGNIQRWQADGRFNADDPIRNPAYPRLEVLSNTGSPNTVESSFWIRSASYTRLKNVQVGYTLPRNIISQIGIANARLYVQAENPYTWHNFPTGWDPEINTGGVYYPILRTYTFGINLKF